MQEAFTQILLFLHYILSINQICVTVCCTTIQGKAQQIITYHNIFMTIVEKFLNLCKRLEQKNETNARNGDLIIFQKLIELFYCTHKFV